MTIPTRYNLAMKHALLLPLGIAGGIWAAVFFAVFFLCVHLSKLVKKGWLAGKNEKSASKKQEPKKEEKPKEKPPETTAPEPVYYIVERKKKRTKSSYGEPKEFKFK